MDRTTLVEAQAAIERGDFGQARSLLDRLLTSTPDEVNTLNLATVLALRERDYARAATLSARALAQRPAHPSLRANRVLALKRYAETCAADGDIPGAAQSLIEALTLMPADQDARGALLDLAVQQAEQQGAPQSLQTIVLPPSPPTLSVITCSIDRAKRARFEASLADHFVGITLQLIVIEDARSLAEAYNRGLDQSTGSLLVFCHDDIEFARPDFAARLLDALATHDLVGVAGCTRITGPSALWSGPEYGYCQVAHVDPAGQLLSSLYGIGPERVSHAQALDGVFLACRRHVAETVRFDAERFDHFHLYDTDFSWRASNAGFQVAIAQDLLLIHHSLGDFNSHWQTQSERFIARFPAVCNEPAHPARVLMRPNRRELLLPTQAWLAEWQARASAQTFPGFR